MAGCDYHHCEVCSGKTFYDTYVEYYDNVVVSLCPTCAKDYEIKIIKKQLEGLE